MTQSTPRIIPTIGRIVLYCLSTADADQINRRRTNGQSIAERVQTGSWPEGAQAHIGSWVKAGDVYPAMVVRVWNDDAINIRVMLDGTDEFWATSVAVSEQPEQGKFHWMDYQKAQASR